MMRAPLPFLPFSLLTTAVMLLVIGVVGIAVLALFRNALYNRLSTRITVLVFAFALVTIIVALAFNEITSDTLSPPWLRQLQIALVVIGGPVVLGLLAARFVRRPLKQFNDAIASLEKDEHKVRLQPTGIREFDEVFTKFNDLMHRLQKEEKLRKDLVSDTSHELNTPLTVMIGQLTAIQEGKYPMTEERVVILKEQAERLAELVQQLNAYTKARTPDGGEVEDIHLKRFVEEATVHFKPELEEKGIQVSIKIDDGFVLRADRGALQGILTNLMQNALRYSGASQVMVSASGRQVTFADNGKGVPAESLPHLFERFYRVEASRNRTTGGLGLGLAIVKELAERQGWHVHAESARPGLAFILNV